MRKLVVLCVIVGVFIVGDMWVKNTAEKRVADQVQASFGSRGDAEVEFAGFPFIVRVATGTIPSATLKSTSLERGGVRLTDLRMTMQDLTFSLSKVIAGEVGSVVVRDGHGRASIPAEELVAAFGEADGQLEIEVLDGRIRVLVGNMEGAARLVLDGTNLVLKAPRVGFFKAALPRFVDGMEYQSVRIDGTDVILEFSLKDAEFRQL